MPDLKTTDTLCEGFDYSTPEAQEALRGVEDILLELRRDYVGPLSRKVALYERTLGLAVVPVLLRRLAIGLARRVRHRDT